MNFALIVVSQATDRHSALTKPQAAIWSHQLVRRSYPRFAQCSQGPRGMTQSPGDLRILKLVVGRLHPPLVCSEVAIETIDRSQVDLGSVAVFSSRRGPISTPRPLSAVARALAADLLARRAAGSFPPCPLLASGTAPSYLHPGHPSSILQHDGNNNNNNDVADLLNNMQEDRSSDSSVVDESALLEGRGQQQRLLFFFPSFSR